MFKLFITVFFTYSFLSLAAQSTLKEKAAFGIHLLTGYVTIPNTDDINAKVTSNNFGPVAKDKVNVGALLNLVAGGSIFKLQFELSWPPSGSRRTHVSTSGVMLSLGHDILPKSEKTMLYPFVGIKYLQYGVTGESATYEKLNAYKTKYSLSTGMGLMQFFSPPLIKRVVNQIDLNAGVNIGLISEKWKDEGAQFVEGTFHKNINFFFTLSVGYGAGRD